MSDTEHLAALNKEDLKQLLIATAAQIYSGLVTARLLDESSGSTVPKKDMLVAAKDVIELSMPVVLAASLSLSEYDLAEAMLLNFPAEQREELHKALFGDQPQCRGCR